MADPRFPPMQNGPPRPSPQRTGGGGLPIIPILLLLIYGAYVGVMIVGPIFSDSMAETMDGLLEANIRLAVGAILLVLFVIILLFSLTDSGKQKGGQRKPAQAPPQRSTPPGAQVKKFKPVSPAGAPAPNTQPAPTPPKPVKEDVKTDPAPVVKRTLIPYPVDVEGGIYGETFIDLGKNKTLKLRSLVVEPEYLY